MVLTSAYVVSMDEDCDLPLKPYFRLATIQVILDVFRKEIIKFVFRFEPSRNQQQIPTRVIVYNLAYVRTVDLILSCSSFYNHSSRVSLTLINFSSLL